MKLNKKNIEKLKVFHINLEKYLNDWESKNYFYYQDERQKELCRYLIEAENTKELNERIKELDKDEKREVKDMLNAKELSFKAGKDKPHYKVIF